MDSFNSKVHSEIRAISSSDMHDTGFSDIYNVGITINNDTRRFIKKLESTHGKHKPHE